MKISELKQILLDHISDRIETNAHQLSEMRKIKISMNSCGAGYCQGAIEELMDIKNLINETLEQVE